MINLLRFIFDLIINKWKKNIIICFIKYYYKKLFLAFKSILLLKLISKYFFS